MVRSLLLLCSLIGLSSDAPLIPRIPEEHVSTSLHGSVTLPCTFSFEQTSEGLSMIWEKEEDNRKVIVYWILKGEINLEEQDPRYRGRVALSKEFSQGHLDLILRDVTYEDEGTYYCRAANHMGRGEKEVTLSIDGLDADLPTVTLMTIDGKRHWKCRGSGVYHNPHVQWITPAGEDLSSYGELIVTNQSDGRKLVESVLDCDPEANVEVLCHIMEGRLKKSARGVISDTEKKEKSPDPDIISSAVMGTLPIIIIIIIIILIGLVLLCKYTNKT